MKWVLSCHFFARGYVRALKSLLVVINYKEQQKQRDENAMSGKKRKNWILSKYWVRNCKNDHNAENWNFPSFLVAALCVLRSFFVMPNGGFLCFWYHKFCNFFFALFYEMPSRLFYSREKFISWINYSMKHFSLSISIACIKNKHKSRKEAENDWKFTCVTLKCKIKYPLAI